MCVCVVCVCDVCVCVVCVCVVCVCVCVCLIVCDSESHKKTALSYLIYCATVRNVATAIRN